MNMACNICHVLSLLVDITIILYNKANLCILFSQLAANILLVTACRMQRSSRNFAESICRKMPIASEATGPFVQVLGKCTTQRSVMTVASSSLQSDYNCIHVQSSHLINYCKTVLNKKVIF
jgi:hypothetical protein